MRARLALAAEALGRWVGRPLGPEYQDGIWECDGYRACLRLMQAQPPAWYESQVAYAGRLRAELLRLQGHYARGGAPLRGAGRAVRDVLAWVGTTGDFTAPGRAAS